MRNQRYIFIKNCYELVESLKLKLPSVLEPVHKNSSEALMLSISSVAEVMRGSGVYHNL